MTRSVAVKDFSLHYAVGKTEAQDLCVSGLCKVKLSPLSGISVILPGPGAPAEGGSQWAGEGAHGRSWKTYRVDILCLILEGTEFRFPDGQVLIQCKKP